MLCTHKTTILCQFGSFVTSLPNHISINSQPFLVGIVSQMKPDATSIAKRALATAMHATRCAASQSLNGLSPGSIAFSRDMFIDIPYVADILTISRSRQALIDSHLLKENAKQISHYYRIGESVMKKSILSLSDKLLDRIPSTTPGEEPPRDARDSGSARSHSTHLETSSSNRP